MWITLTFLVLIACAFMRRHNPHPAWTYGVVVSFFVLIALMLAPSKKDDFVRQFDRVYELSGRELGRMVAAQQPQGPIVVLMEHDARVNQERLDGLRRELNRHGLRIHDVIVLPAEENLTTFSAHQFETVKGQSYAAVVSFYGLPPIKTLDSTEWPDVIVVYAPYGDQGFTAWAEAGILKGALVPNQDFTSKPLSELPDADLVQNYYRVTEYP